VTRLTLVLLLPSLLATACGGSRDAAERHVVYVRATMAEFPMVWIADANALHARRLAPGFSGLVSPDGRTVAVERRDGIYLVSSDAMRTRHLTSTVFGPQAWSPDGKRIVAGGKRSLVVVEVDSGRSRVVARGAFYGFGFSPDGGRLVYARAPREARSGICGARIDLYVADVAGGAGRRLTRDGRSAFPVWASSRIAFGRLPKPARYDDCFAAGIWTVRPDGSHLRALLARAPRAISRGGYTGLRPFAWSPDGDLVVGIRSEWGDEAAVLDLRTHRLRRLGLYVDKASRDGRLVLGSGGNDKVTISITRVRDGHRLFVRHGDVCCPDWNR